MDFYGKKHTIPLNLIFIGIITFVYDMKIIDIVDSLIFRNESISAFKFTFSKFILLPVSLYLAYFTLLFVLLIIQKLRNGSVNKPDKSLILKHGYLFVAVLIATVIAMQCHTILYTDGRIVSNNYIEKLSPQYTAEDYSKVVFYGESIGSSSPKRAPRTSFQFYFVFHIDENKYIQFYPEEFRNNKAILSLSETLGEKFQVLPEGGLPTNVIVNMDESEYELYSMMYAGRITLKDYDGDEEETEQEHYAFDGYYDFK